MRPYFIEQRLKLRTPIYSETAAYGHMGRTPEIKTVTFTKDNLNNGEYLNGRRYLRRYDSDRSITIVSGH